MAVRDNKIAADSIGISTSHYKLLAFVVSAGVRRHGGHAVRDELLHRNRCQV